MGCATAQKEFPFCPEYYKIKSRKFKKVAARKAEVNTRQSKIALNPSSDFVYYYRVRGGLGTGSKLPAHFSFLFLQIPFTI